MDSDKNITATFTAVQPDQVTLTMNVAGSGSVSPPAGTHTYDEGTTLTLTATPDAGWLFDGWSGDVSGSSSSLTITLNSDTQVTANFVEEDPDPVYYTLTLAVSGEGSVSDVGGTYEANTQVSIMAYPAAGNIFAGWSGDASGTSETITITMDSDKAVTASFVVDDPTPVCDGGNVTNVSLTFTHDGPGEYCWFTTDDISYINSWATHIVEINGVDYTNVWSNSMPAKADGE
mgnify:CR=1 FL=1